MKSLYGHFGMLLLITTVIASCTRTRIVVEAVANTIVVTDATTNEKLDEFLLVSIWYEKAEVLQLGPAHSNGIGDVVRVEIVELDSGAYFTQPAIVSICKGRTGTLQHLEYAVLKYGYYEGGPGLNGNMVAGYVKDGKPVSVKMQRDEPGQSESDISAVVDAEYFCEKILPVMRLDDRLRGAVISVLQKRLEGVIAAGKYRQADSDELMALSKKLASFRSAGGE